MDLFNALAAKYIQIQLIFPTHSIEIKDFTDATPAAVGHLSIANIIELKH